MDPIITSVVSSGIVAIITGGIAAWGGAKKTEGIINGMREQSKRVENKIDAHMEDSTEFKIEVSSRLTRIETKLED